VSFHSEAGVGVGTVHDRELSALYVCLVGLGKERDEEQIQSMLPLWCPGAKSRTMDAIRVRISLLPGSVAE
jgi:hypothetical protein